MSTKVEELVDYHGECICTRAKCDKKAYFTQNGRALCGYCSQKLNRRPLPKNPQRARNLARAYDAHKASVDTAARTNAAAGKHGTVTCCKMTMFQGQQPVFVPGVANVFPNYKHKNRYGGWGMPELSPKSMGPVEHPQLGLPPAKNLENFHQFSKLFPGESMPDFRRSQKAAFRDPEPHRHKPQALQQKAGANKNIPRCWIWTRADGTVVRKSYIECRQFYCNYYDRFASESDDYPELVKALDDGTNLRICGFDGYMPDKTIMEHYLDDSRPFGHELVLFTMLTVPEAKWPWRELKTEDF